MDSNLAEFVRESIRSVWNLELLLCLSRNAGRAWRADELVRELRASDFVVSEGMTALEAAGLVAEAADGTYRYMPASAALDQQVHELAKEYRERPQTVTRAIFSRPPDKLQTLADAFKLKKD